MNDLREAGRVKPAWRGRICGNILYLLATLQVVWAYHSRTLEYLNIDKYERGTEVTPCQTRILMMLILRWAHYNVLLVHLADILSRNTPIYRTHIYPESIVFAIADYMGILLAGWVAVRIYHAASEHRILTPYIYPLVLVFCVCEYILLALHPYRFFYDMPSLGFFAVGLYLIYFRRNPLYFAALFVVATLNRETTLLLLLFFVLAQVAEGGVVDWRRSYRWGTIAVVLPLGIFWTGWHIFVNQVYAANHFAWIPAAKINAVLLVWPPAWPQMLGAGCYSIVPVFVYRRYIKDPTLQIWLWTLPVWFAIIFLYAIVVEIRLYAELTPYFVCVAAIAMEGGIVARLTERGSGHIGSRPVALE
jgi:hypothetical protein